MSRTPSTAPNLCGCWNSVNSRPDLDLRDSLHGWRGHGKPDLVPDGHATTRHAWCDICSPNNTRAKRDRVTPWP